MNNTIMHRGAPVEVRFGTVSEAPNRGRHTRARTFEVTSGGERFDLELHMGQRIKPSDAGPAFERSQLRRQPEFGVEICFAPATMTWGFKRFYDSALAHQHQAVEDPDQALARQWAELPPEELAAFASGRNTGVSHRGKFPEPARRHRR